MARCLPDAARSVLPILATLCSCAQALAITVDVSIQRHSYCGRESGFAVAFAGGGVPPYTFNWSNGSTTEVAEGLFPGDYSVTVTDSQLDQATANFTILLLNAYDYESVPLSLAHCPGDPGLVVAYTGMQPFFQQPPPSGLYGPNPYTFSHPQLMDNLQSVHCYGGLNEAYELLAFSGPTPAVYMVDYWDAAGCPGQMQVVVGPEWNTLPEVAALNVVPSCASTATGSITFSAAGLLSYTYTVILRPAAVPDECAPQAEQFVVEGGVGWGTYTKNNLLPGDYWLITSNDARHAPRHTLEHVHLQGFNAGDHTLIGYRLWGAHGTCVHRRCC